MSFLANHCDGAGPHHGPPVVRVYPLGAGGNLILCRACWERENLYRRSRGIEMKAPENWPVQDWSAAEILRKRKRPSNRREDMSP